MSNPAVIPAQPGLRVHENGEPVIAWLIEVRPDRTVVATPITARGAAEGTVVSD